MQLTHAQIAILLEVKAELKSCKSTPSKIEQLAHKYNIPRSLLTRGFLFLFQISPYQFWLECVMEYARQQVLAGVSVKDITHQLGYSTQQNFSRAFKSIYKITPRRLLMTAKIVQRADQN